MGDLGINLPGLITQLVSFLILFFLLYKALYKPVIRMLDQRAEKIKASLEAAEDAKKQAESSAERVEHELTSARQEGQKLIELARSAASRYEDDQKARALHEVEQMLSKARSDIQHERDAAIEEVRRQFADLAVTAAEKVVQRSLDRRAHAEVIDRVLKEGLSERKN